MQSNAHFPLHSKEREELRPNRNVVLLGLVSMLNDLSTEMIVPLLPMLLAGVGAGGFAVGVFGGLRDAVSSLLKILFGWWSDKIGERKRFVFVGYFISALFKFFLGLTRTTGQIVTFGTLERIGKGIRTAPRDAMIAYSVPNQSGKGFGIHRTMDTVGALVGSLLAFLLYWFLKMDLNKIILIAAIIALPPLVPLKFVRDPRIGGKASGMKIDLKSLPKQLRLFILIAALFSIANISYLFFILRSKDLFSGRMSIGAPVLLYTLFSAIYALLAIPFGSLSDRLGRRSVLKAGYILFTFVCLGFAFLNSQIALILLFSIYGLVFAMTDGNQRALVSDLSLPELKGTALGAFHTVTGLSAIPIGAIAGLLWEIDSKWTFVFGSCLAASAAIIISFIPTRDLSELKQQQ
ncbi:MAG: MFS transporter [bacterium]